MAWAIVNTAPVTIPMGKWELVNSLETYVITSTTLAIGTICNLIEYDGVSPYDAPTNYKLEQVPDTAKIGDTGY